PELKIGSRDIKLWPMGDINRKVITFDDHPNGVANPYSTFLCIAQGPYK
ncbi:13323_t:CDS:1, partial [Rhizophagus irregularis]